MAGSAWRGEGCRAAQAHPWRRGRRPAVPFPPPPLLGPARHEVAREEASMRRAECAVVLWGSGGAYHLRPAGPPPSPCPAPAPLPVSAPSTHAGRCGRWGGAGHLIIEPGAPPRSALLDALTPGVVVCRGPRASASARVCGNVWAGGPCSPFGGRAVRVRRVTTGLAARSTAGWPSPLISRPHASHATLTPLSRGAGPLKGLGLSNARR